MRPVSRPEAKLRGFTLPSIFIGIVLLALALSSCGPESQQVRQSEIVSQYWEELPAEATVLGFVDGSQVDIKTLQTENLSSYANLKESEGLLIDSATMILSKSEVFSLFNDRIQNILTPSGQVTTSATGLRALNEDGSLRGELEEFEIKRFGPNLFLIARGSSYVTKDGEPSCLTLTYPINLIKTSKVADLTISNVDSTSDYALAVDISNNLQGPSCSGVCCSRCSLSGILNPSCKCSKKCNPFRGHCNMNT